MSISMVRRSVVGFILFLAVVVAGCAQQFPPPATQQEVQELRERVATLEVRVEAAQAAPAPAMVGREELMTHMADLQQRMQAMMQQAQPDPEAMAEMQQEMQTMLQQMQQMMGGRPAMPDMDQMSQMMTMMQTMMQMMATPEAQPQRQPMMGGMAGMEQTAGEFAPLVKGLYEGEELFFIHTEASDPQVAQMLTVMMGPQVVLVPRLADAPASLLANVYVFTNGVKGGGPFGFQPDVFDSIPGDEGYSPLRAVNLVTWKEGAEARVLGSVEEVRKAESEGEITIERPGVVVNVPVLVWPGGHR